MLRGYGESYAAPLLAALATEPSVSVRANVLKGCRPPEGADTVPWLGSGYYLPQRPLFAADPAWHQGLYYVQDASSMVYGHIVADVVSRFFEGRDNLRYLDACAAPGGKTGAAVESLPPSALVVSNEYDRHRANILAENVARQGAPGVVVSCADAADFGRMADAFDIIAVDAPCSGEGMMRKEPEAVRQWSPALIAECAAMQRRLLESLWHALRPGGVLIYSTCTFNRTENEVQLESFAADTGAESIDLGLDSFAGVLAGIDTRMHCYRFAPGHVRGEGLFVGALRKPGEYVAPKENARRRASAPAKSKAVPVTGLRDAGAYVTVEEGGVIYARPAAHASFIAELGRQVRLLRPGLPVATVKGRDLIPAHELALSTAFDPAAFPAIEVDYAGALSYLHGDSLTDVDSSLPRGFATVCYGGLPLGFVKNIGRRANNLCPDALRLRLDPGRLAGEAPQPIVSR